MLAAFISPLWKAVQNIFSGVKFREVLLQKQYSRSG